MIAEVSYELRNEIEDAMQRWMHRQPTSILPETQDGHIVGPAVASFWALAEQLDRNDTAHATAIFRDEDSSWEKLPVLLAPNLVDVDRSQDLLIGYLRDSGIHVDRVSQNEARSIFVDRLAEFAAAASSSSGQPGSVTKVTSNRSGDTVLYCKGFFVSTSQGFGVSTPAVNLIPAGRYSFGIMDNGKPRFEPVLWTCPAAVPLNLP